MSVYDLSSNSLPAADRSNKNLQVSFASFWDFLKSAMWRLRWAFETSMWCTRCKVHHWEAETRLACTSGTKTRLDLIACNVSCIIITFCRMGTNLMCGGLRFAAFDDSAKVKTWWTLSVIFPLQSALENFDLSRKLQFTSTACHSQWNFQARLFCLRVFVETSFTSLAVSKQQKYFLLWSSNSNEFSAQRGKQAHSTTQRLC